MSNNQPFNPDEFAKWLVEGVKDTIQYRIKQTFNREHILEYVKSKIPTRSQLFHKAMKQAFLKNGFTFDLLQQGDAAFHLIRKRIKKEGPIERRLVLVPGFGDTPTSWITTFAFCKKEIEETFDEILVIDFPGYLGFLSHTQMVPSMEVLLSVVQTVCDATPPTVLIGHSLGGWLAGRVAQKLSRPLEHLLLIAPSGLTPDDDKPIFADFILSMQGTPFDVMISKMIHEPKRYHQFLKQEFEYFYAKPEIKEFVSSVKPHHFIDPQSSFECHQLTIIWGEQDEFVPAHWMRFWVECFGPYLDGYFLNKTGHLPQIESPLALAELLKEILFGRPNQEGEERWQKIISRSKSFDLGGSRSSPGVGTPLLGYEE